MHKNNLLSTWDAFLHALEMRFGSSSYDNHCQAMFKVRQMGSVAEYRLEFERLCNRVVGLSPDSILDCFLSFLYSGIQKDMAILHPTTISQAVGLVKLLESKLHDHPFLTRASGLETAPIHSVPPLLPAPQPRPLPPLGASLPIRRLSLAEMQACHAKGLCFNCDQRFHLGHKCKPKQFLPLLVDESLQIPFILPILPFLRMRQLWQCLSLCLFAHYTTGFHTAAAYRTLPLVPGCPLKLSFPHAPCISAPIFMAMPSQFWLIREARITLCSYGLLPIYT